MQWILQEFEDSAKLAGALNRLGIPFTWHKVVPFAGTLLPEPDVGDPNAVVMFGSYSFWRYAEAHNLRPGVFRIRPFILEAPWHPYLLNGTDARILRLRDVPEQVADDGSSWFLRPVEDSKEVPGRVVAAGDIVSLARNVLALDESEIPIGSLRHDTRLMLTRPARIHREWRLWVVHGRIVTYSLYKDGSRVVYRHEIEQDVLEFAQVLADANPAYSPAYVMDVCRTDQGLRMVETNCLNAAGFYAADVANLVVAIEALGPG